MLACPNCYSEHLMIRRCLGFERLMVYLTGKRKYICVGCGRVFRAPDRRRVRRESEATVLSEAQRGRMRA